MRRQSSTHDNTGAAAAAAAPLYVELTDGEAQPLPSPHYIRIVAMHNTRDTNDAVTGDGVSRCVFALHHRGARFCRLLDSLLDAYDMESATQRISDVRVDGADHTRRADSAPPVVIPQATRAGCVCLFRYIDKILTRVPSLISKPLRAPLEELTQPWEMQYLLDCCSIDTPVAEATTAAAGDGGSSKSSSSGGNKDKGPRYSVTSTVMQAITKHGQGVLDRLLEVAMLSEFLLIDSLRELICAFLAALAVSVTTVDELLRLCGRDKLLTEQELEPLYAQFPFLRVTDDA